MSEENEHETAIVNWEGDSLEILRSFPKAVRADLGAELRRLQRGESSMHSRPMKTIGRRVYELKEQDKAGWYRVIYLAKVGNTINVIHCFKKNSKKTSRNDLEIAKSRLKNVFTRFRRQKENEKKNK